MTKPFHQEEVLVRIQTHLERSRLASELARLNRELEAEVQARTRELEGKDRIAEHLLKYHTLEETLELVLEVVAQLVEVERAVFYLCDGAQPRTVAALGSDGSALNAEQLAQLKIADTLADELTQLTLEQPKPSSEKPARALLPLARGGEVMGVL
ncbi:MAG: nitrate/nitrite-specific signal transduction histidine kinase [Candidatus Latescibacterota bacterium]|jgi:nitrate/nitrite-specific signal transduction histidine kinase